MRWLALFPELHALLGDNDDRFYFATQAIKAISVRSDVRWSSTLAKPIVTKYQVAVDGLPFAELTASDDRSVALEHVNLAHELWDGQHNNDITMSDLLSVLNKYPSSEKLADAITDFEPIEADASDVYQVGLDDFEDEASGLFFPEIAEHRPIMTIRQWLMSDADPETAGYIIDRLEALESWAAIPGLEKDANKASRHLTLLRAAQFYFERRFSGVAHSAIPQWSRLMNVSDFSICRIDRSHGHHAWISESDEKSELDSYKLSTVLSGTGLILRNFLAKLLYIGPIRESLQRVMKLHLLQYRGVGHQVWVFGTLHNDEALVQAVDRWMSSSHLLDSGYGVERRVVRQIYEDGDLGRLLANSNLDLG